MKWLTLLLIPLIVATCNNQVYTPLEKNEHSKFTNSIELKEFRLNLEKNLKKVGFMMSKEEILNQYKKISEKLTKIKVGKVSGHSDNIIMHVITVIDMIKKSVITE